jgi:hypothetical protein
MFPTDTSTMFVAAAGTTATAGNGLQTTTAPSAHTPAAWKFAPAIRTSPP